MKSSLVFSLSFIFIALLVSCDGDDSKPISKTASYPESLYGTWKWPCEVDYDTERTSRQLYRQQKRTYAESGAYVFERTTYKDSNCSTIPIAKGVHEGVYTIVTEITADTDTNEAGFFVEIDYVLTNVIFEGNKPIAATTASRNRHKVGFAFYGIARVYPELGELHIGWNREMENVKMNRPKILTEVLHASTVLEPNYTDVLALRTYDTLLISDIVGRWTENCRYAGESEGIFYYKAWKYEITAAGVYDEKEGLYDNDSCTGTPISFYSYPGTIAILTSFGNNGVAATNLEGVSGVYTVVTRGATQESISTNIGLPQLKKYSPPSTVYDVMISDTSSDYLFLYGNWDASEPVGIATDLEINDIFVREP